MLNLKKFETISEYNTYINNNPILPNVSVIGDSIVRYNSIVRPGSICYYDGSSLKFCTKDNWDSSLGTPIGVVVIPPEHTLDGKVRVMSLKAMRYDTPDTGGADQSMFWGGNRYDAGVSKVTKVPTWDNVIGGTVGNNGYGYMPSDNTSFTGATCVCDSKTKYFGSTPYIPSPYLENGNRNTALDVTLSGGNALADFNGKANTTQILSMATAQTDWRTASTITNKTRKGYYPAACCCWRYSTSGTSQGDWYLPAAGELAYIIPRLKEINESITAVDGITLPSNWLWSSSESSVYYSYYVYTNDGFINTNFKDDFYSVRAFLSVSSDSTIDNGGGIIEPNNGNYLKLSGTDYINAPSNARGTILKVGSGYDTSDLVNNPPILYDENENEITYSSLRISGSSLIVYDVDGGWRRMNISTAESPTTWIIPMQSGG